MFLAYHKLLACPKFVAIYLFFSKYRIKQRFLLCLYRTTPEITQGGPTMITHMVLSIGLFLLTASTPLLSAQAKTQYNAKASHDLIVAVQINDSIPVQALLQNPHINVNIQDRTGRTPLMHAARLGNLAVAQLLLADSRTKTNAQSVWDLTAILKNTTKEFGPAEGMTALMWAALSENPLLVKEILAHLEPGEVNTQDDLGNTALLYAVREGHDLVVAELLLDTSIIIDICNAKKESPLSLAESKYASCKDPIIKLCCPEIIAKEPMYAKIVRLLTQQITTNQTAPNSPPIRPTAIAAA